MYVVKGRLTCIKCDFDKQNSIIHKLIYATPEIGDLSANCPVEFSETGLHNVNSSDDYSITLAKCTDESTPCMITDTVLGGNHGMPCAITVIANNHNKTLKDVGAIYTDENNTPFVLVKVLDDDNLIFVHYNQNERIYKSDYIKEINGTLNYLENGNDTKSVTPLMQSCGFLCRANRYTKKQLKAYKNGQEVLFITSTSDCDLVKIIEEYLVINPVSCVKELVKKRPKSGYTHKIDVSEFGNPIIESKVNYLVQSDGTVVIEFNYERVSQFEWRFQMGFMAQSKSDVYGGGVYRYIPKTKPLVDEDGVYDFTKPSPIYPKSAKLFPKKLDLTKEFWQDKNSPPDRVVDYFKDTNGNDKLCFACGYLPIYDCEKSVRANNINSAFSVVHTRKVYPIVKDGKFDNVKGVAYKKYFIPCENGVSIYSVNYQNKNYIYADFFKQGKCEYDIKGKITLYEKSDDISYEIKDNKLIITSLKNGCSLYATFIEEV